MLKIWLAASFMISFLVNAKENRDFFIGINGSVSYQGNNSDFEVKDLKGLRDAYPPENRIILNSEGKTATFSAHTDTLPNGVSMLARTLFGDLIYIPTQIPESRPATKREIDMAVSEVSQKSPDKVVLLYGNHGLPKGPSTLTDTLDIKSVREHEGAFSPETVVQRIHLHCYSGAMTVLSEKRFAFEEVAQAFFNKKQYDRPTEEALLRMFKKNRCAVSNAGKYEVSIQYTDLTALLNKDKSITLENFYFALLKEEIVNAPQITSMEFLKVFAQIKCDSVTEGRVCDFGLCSPIKSLCEKKKWFPEGEFPEDWSLLGSYSQYLLEKQNPDLATRRTRALERYNQLIFCREDAVEAKVKGILCPKEMEKELTEVQAVFKEYETASAEISSSDEFVKSFAKEVSKASGASEEEIIKYLSNDPYKKYHDSGRKEQIVEAIVYYKSFEHYLAGHSKLKELYDSIVACEKMPLLPRK